ncbi:MAG TPA: class I SAM-dependent methyltransferase, partial [Pseudonocardiaceae bacterium]|nr:class I SAM-dependent methyltransferase [Pseudonocardiaceae bacterium]
MTTDHDLLVEPGEQYRTRPGTPMIGPYSTNQMDNFYTALAAGRIKPTGIMNLFQRLYIAERCRPDDRVVDVCCGRGLQLPVLYQYAPDIGGYVGLDISPDNLVEARDTQARLHQQHGTSPFEVVWVKHDVAQPWPDLGGFDVAVYTSALEHLPRDLGIGSLRHTAMALRPGGLLFLSTPNTPGPPPRPLQHRVHVYEWNTDELMPVL